MRTSSLEPGEGSAVPDLVGLIGRIADLVDRGLPVGDVADLRRMEPGDIGPPALWKLIALVLEPAGQMRGTDPGRTLDEQRWASVVNCLAWLRGLHHPGCRLGNVLATSGFSELRFLRILRTAGPALAKAAQGSARWCASRGESVDAVDLARLILSDGRRDEELVRRQIARDYFGQVARGTRTVYGSEE